MFEPRRLHLVAAVLTVLRDFRHLVVPLGIGFVSFVGRFGLERHLWLYVLGGLVVLSLLAGWGVASWYRHTYRVEDGELRIEQGVVFRKRRFIPQERIQSVDLTETVLHRLFKVVKVRVETAGGTGPEAELSAVTRKEAEQLRHALMTKHTEQAVADEEGSEATKVSATFQQRLTLPHLIMAGVTSGSIGVVFSLIFGGLSFIGNVLPESFIPSDEVVFGFFDRFLQLGPIVWIIIFLVVTVLLLAWLFAIAGTVVTFWGFTLTRDGDDILLERGLLERRRSTIPLGRIQAVRVVESPFRQPFGLATLHVESAGYGQQEGVSTILFPLIKRREVAAFLQEVAPEFASTQTLNPLSTAARRRAVRRLLIPAVILSGVTAVLLFPWGLWSLLLLPLAILYGRLRYRDAGWAMYEDTLILRSRFINRTTALTTRLRVQSSGLKQSPFQRRANLMTFHVHVASGSVGATFRIVDVTEREGMALLHRVSANKRLSHN